MSKIWKFGKHDESLIRQLSSELKVSALVAQVLLARGFQSIDDAQDFLQPSLRKLHEPSLLPNLDEAADRIVEAIRSNRRITVYGDYDVDGVTATSLLLRCVQLATGTIDFYIPDRGEEGYGLNSDAIRKLHEEDPERLVVTVDCGIASVKEAALAKELGLELIITDHHQFADELPDALLIHPRLPESEYPFGDLCGVGVAFKLAWGIAQRLGDGQKASPEMREFLMFAVGLAALGTIADVVPLRDENRILVRYGLRQLSEQPPLGIQVLMKILEISSKRTLTADDIAFKIAPRINAAGRLKQARLAVELLTTEDEERASLLAGYLNQLNRDRQTLERRMVKQAKEQVQQNPEWDRFRSIVLSDPDWHPGVIGIVASRVANHFQKPAFIIAIDKQTQSGQGSGRSYGNVNLYAALTACHKLLISYGGHHAAAGLKIDPDQIEEFRELLHEVIQEHQANEEYVEEHRIDTEVRLADVHLQSVRELDLLGPFGQSNTAPLFAANNVTLAEPPRRIGELQNHLLLQVQQYGKRMKAISFGKGDWADDLAQLEESFSICFVPLINEFRGRLSVELELVDWIPTSKLSAHLGAPV